MTAIDAIEELRNEVPHKLSQDRVETLEGFRPRLPRKDPEGEATCVLSVIPR